VAIAALVAFFLFGVAAGAMNAIGGDSPKFKLDTVDYVPPPPDRGDDRR